MEKNDVLARDIDVFRKAMTSKCYETAMAEEHEFI